MNPVLVPLLAVLLAPPPTGLPAVHDQATAAAASRSSTLRLEPLGDSITYGSHSSTGNGYRGPLWNTLTAEGHQLDFVGEVHEGTMADSDNEGFPGWRIDALQGIVNGSLTAYRPNVVTLLAGANDLIQNHDVAGAPARLSALIDQITTGAPDATVLVGTLTASTNANLVAGRSAFNAAIPGIVQSKQAAGKHVASVDMGALTTADLVSDGIHPNDGGYQKMADAWNAGIQTADAAGWITAPVGNGGPTAEIAGQVSAGTAGKCLDVNAGSANDGTPVQVWTCNHSRAQFWTGYSDGTLRALGKCLDAAAGGTTNGTKTQLYTCNGTAAQLWQAANGAYVNVASGRCLDNPNPGGADGTQLQLWDCNGGTNQKWAPAGLGAVVSGNGGKCLDDYSGANVNGTKADLWDCNSSQAQQWVARDNTLQASSLCLDINGGGTANGTLVQLWDCNGTGGQKWVLNANGTLQNPQSGRCLDDPGFATTNGVQLDIWDCNNGTNQQWTLATTQRF